MSHHDLGKLLIIIGIIFIIVGLAYMFGGKWISHLNFGKLPGDIAIKKEGISFHFPIVTSIIISVVLSILLNIFIKK